MSDFVENSTEIKRGEDYGVRRFQASSQGRLLATLCTKMEINFEIAQSLLKLGAVYVNDVRQTSDGVLNGGDLIRAHTTPRRFRVSKVKVQDLLLHEDEDYVVVNKPAGIPVHALVDNEKENLLTILSTQMGMDLRITSRLDVATRGVLVFAKNAESQRRYNEEIRRGQVQKIYWARTHGNPFVGNYIHYMVPSPVAPKKLRRREFEGSLRCEMKVLEVNALGDFADAKIELISGRTHQIRAQLSYETFPIQGDTLYGGGPSLSTTCDSIALECSELRFGRGKYEFTLDSTFDVFD